VAKQQFNVNLPPELVRRAKHQAIDDQLSLSDWVEGVLLAHLERRVSMDPLVTFQPMIHVEDVAAAVGFYEALGARLLHGSRDGDFVMLSLGGAQFSLLGHPANPEQGEGAVEMNFEAAVPLEQVADSLRAAGFDPLADPVDEGFGRQLLVKAPDGLLIKINELEPELYT
jgi:catechol 2,3-dioxygenase-like lactoylglutathione lyase family enzyme